MTPTDLLAILPFLVLAAVSVLLMLMIGIRRDHRMCAAAAASGLMLAIAAIAVAGSRAPRQVTPLFVIDGYALFYVALILASALAVVLLSFGYLERYRVVPHPGAPRPHQGGDAGRRGDPIAANAAPRGGGGVRTGANAPREEYYVLLLLGTLGAAAIVASRHFAGFFLGLETLSISLLGLIAYPRGFERPMEAGIKYLILSGVSSAFLLFGIALIYAELGTMSFAAASPVIKHGDLRDFFWLAGGAMVLTGIGFKLSVVPFHMWAPDVYEGAPAPVTAFVAVVSKTAVFALLLRYFVVAEAFDSYSLALALAVIAVLSMLAGNLLALLQTNVKRILAYSSIAHLGYVLVALLASGSLAIEAVSIYLVAYAIMTLGAFGIVTLLSRPDRGRDADELADYRGLLWSRPFLAVVFAAMLLGLAGIPLTAGFIAKFYAVTAGVGASLAAPVAALVAGSIIGLYYYLRIIVTMAMPFDPNAPAGKVEPRRLGAAVIAVLAALLVGLGVYPAPLIATVRTTAVALAAASADGKLAAGLAR